MQVLVPAGKKAIVFISLAREKTEPALHLLNMRHAATQTIGRVNSLSFATSHRFPKVTVHSFIRHVWHGHLSRQPLTD